MNWVLASIFMFISSVNLYLAIRKIQIEKVSIETYSLFMFGVPIIGSLLVVLFTSTSLLISLWHLFLIIIAAVLFSYLGNKFSQKSILYAPNPGYALIISKSYVVFTSIAAIFLFNSPLTFKSVVAILLIVSFSALIMIGKDTKKVESKKSWLAYSIGTFFCWGFLALMSTYLINQQVNVFAYQFYINLFVTGVIFGETKIQKVTVSFKKNNFLLLIAIGIFSTLFNLFMQVGYKSAPNPGYISAVNASSISAVTIASAIIFKDELTRRKLIGVIGVTIGLLLLLIK